MGETLGEFMGGKMLPLVQLIGQVQGEGGEEGGEKLKGIESEKEKPGRDTPSVTPSYKLTR